MNDADLFSLLADAILVTHFAFVVFVVLGFLAILLGLLARWSWLHKLLFYEAEPWVFTTIYTGFGVLVVLVWFLGKRSRR